MLNNTAARSAAVFAVCAVFAVSCRRARPVVRPGDSVVLRYELSVDGAVRESNFDGEPATVVQGSGVLPPGVDAALLGLAVGEEKRLELPPSRAFGERDASKIQILPVSDFGALAKDLKPGKKISGFRDGKAEEGVVVAVSGGRATLDFNPPLAGKTVSYRIRVDSISK